MQFRLVLYKTKEENKYEAEERFEYLGNRESIWYLWYAYIKEMGYPHVEVYSLNGIKQKPEDGISGLQYYSL